MQQITLPKKVEDAFPILKDVLYIRSYAPSVPFAPDTLFHIYMNDKGLLVSLVATDYVDLTKQQADLLQASGQYEFRFEKIFKLDGGMADELEAETSPESVFIHDESTYYYLAKISGKLG